MAQGWKGQSSAPAQPQRLQEQSFPGQGLKAALGLLEQLGRAIPFGEGWRKEPQPWGAALPAGTARLPSLQEGLI